MKLNYIATFAAASILTIAGAATFSNTAFASTPQGDVSIIVAENPCAGAEKNPCAGENPCAGAANPCAGENPCAGAGKNPCAGENPCAGAANPCAGK